MQRACVDSVGPPRRQEGAKIGWLHSREVAGGRRAAEAIGKEVDKLPGVAAVGFESFCREAPLLPEVGAGFHRLASATARLRPTGVLKVLTLGVHGRFDLRQLALDRFRTGALQSIAMGFEIALQCEHSDFYLVLRL